MHKYYGYKKYNILFSPIGIGSFRLEQENMRNEVCEEERWSTKQLLLTQSSAGA